MFILSITANDNGFFLNISKVEKVLGNEYECHVRIM
jgi:hypothetical protein